MKSTMRGPGIRRIGVETENDPRNDLESVAIERADPLQERHHHVVLFRHRLERFRLRRLDSAEHRLEPCLPHQFEDFRPFCEIERASQANMKG